MEIKVLSSEDVSKIRYYLKFGNYEEFFNLVPDVFVSCWSSVHEAFYGSLDAAVEVKNTILPDWSWQADEHGSASLTRLDDENLDKLSIIDERIERKPARALLMCIIVSLAQTSDVRV